MKLKFIAECFQIFTINRFNIAGCLLIIHISRIVCVMVIKTYLLAVVQKEGSIKYPAIFCIYIIAGNIGKIQF